MEDSDTSVCPRCLKIASRCRCKAYRIKETKPMPDGVPIGVIMRRVMNKVRTGKPVRRRRKRELNG